MSTTSRPINSAEPPPANPRRRRERRVTVAIAVTSGLAAMGTLLGALRLWPLPDVCVLGGLAIAVVIGLLVRWRFEVGPRVEAVLLACAIGVAGALVLRPALAPYVKAASLDANQRMVERVIALDRELKLWAQRTDRAPGEPALPANKDFFTFLRGLEDGAPLLANPWGGPPQAEWVGFGPAAGILPTAAELAKGAPPATMRMPIGPGQLPGVQPYQALTYGAVLYDYDPASGRYVLYGIGEAGGKAVVVHQTTGPS